MGRADDAAQASAALKGETSGKEHKPGAEEAMARVGSTVDRSVEEGSLLPLLPPHPLLDPLPLMRRLTRVKTGKGRISAGAQKLENTKDQTKASVLGKIDETDRKIENEAAQAKGGIMNWFGK